ncbi:hypothetical protein [Streptomyces sp. NBC_01497]|uniref:hypothetical protein n=1 Tax=Streptomyces sp. NBC_01497 TaxID=2903885 RepID=UPI002E32702F|nr:hypothetical protein [Streptomyces sp. NBC_01497]
MGSFFKTCECRRPSRCPHLHTIRFRNSRGKQAEEFGYSNQYSAIDRLIELYTARKTTPKTIAEQQETLGEMIFEEYAKAWFARKRGLTGSTKAATESRLRTHSYPEIGSRKMHTFDSFVVERFITAKPARVPPRPHRDPHQGTGRPPAHGPLDLAGAVLDSAHVRGGTRRQGFHQ